MFLREQYITLVMFQERALFYRWVKRSAPHLSNGSKSAPAANGVNGCSANHIACAITLGHVQARQGRLPKVVGHLQQPIQKTYHLHDTHTTQAFSLEVINHKNTTMAACSEGLSDSNAVLHEQHIDISEPSSILHPDMHLPPCLNKGVIISRSLAVSLTSMFLL